MGRKSSQTFTILTQIATHKKQMNIRKKEKKNTKDLLSQLAKDMQVSKVFISFHHCKSYL